jgi:predicted metal-dependent hydrolase
MSSKPTHLDVEKYRRGIHLFNHEDFFDAHEVWEDVWREAEGREKTFLQGLIQVAVAFHHHSTGNLVGARSLLGRAGKNLAGYPEEFLGIGVTALLDSMAKWEAAMSAGGSKPAFPRLDPIE